MYNLFSSLLNVQRTSVLKAKLSVILKLIYNVRYMLSASTVKRSGLLNAKRHSYSVFN